MKKIYQIEEVFPIFSLLLFNSFFFISLYIQYKKSCQYIDNDYSHSHLANRIDEVKNSSSQQIITYFVNFSSLPFILWLWWASHKKERESKKGASCNNSHQEIQFFPLQQLFRLSCAESQIICCKFSSKWFFFYVAKGKSALRIFRKFKKLWI